MFETPNARSHPVQQIIDQSKGPCDGAVCKETLPPPYLFVCSALSCAVLRVSSAALIRNPGLSEKWGWSETAHKWYYPLKALGVFSKKNTRALASSRMLQTCLNNAEVRSMRCRLETIDSASCGHVVFRVLILVCTHDTPVR